jgi:hypothetical protein
MIARATSGNLAYIKNIQTPPSAKDKAGNNFRFLSEPWSIALRLLSTRSRR